MSWLSGFRAFIVRYNVNIQLNYAKTLAVWLLQQQWLTLKWRICKNGMHWLYIKICRGMFSSQWLRVKLTVSSNPFKRNHKLCTGFLFPVYNIGYLCQAILLPYMAVDKLDCWNERMKTVLCCFMQYVFMSTKTNFAKKLQRFMKVGFTARLLY